MRKFAPRRRTWYRPVTARAARAAWRTTIPAPRKAFLMNATEIRTRFLAALDNILSDDEVPAEGRALPTALSEALIDYRLSTAKPGQDLTVADITMPDITQIDRLKAGTDATAATLRKITQGQDDRALRLAFLYYCQAITRMAS
ncbi:hypothetical protein CFR71_08525 [Novacetimonas pomaceti]|uniref:Uncharacterized protein n=2 Tax=Novacetimonas pomaceti TaxID=2021998 RepID=A0A318Q7F4_9PROT|nr:hypothetical protein CFR71_08525 [Novacetimonas pomaceti]